MNTGTIRDFIVENDLEFDLLNFVPKSEQRDIRIWLKSEELGY